MIKIHTRLFKRLLALGFMCFIVNQAFAYEKSGFFVGIQGSKTNYKVVEKIDSAYSIVNTNISASGHLSDVSCESSNSSSSTWYGKNETTITTTCKPSLAYTVVDGNSSISLFMDTLTTIVKDKPNTYGGVVGYKHFFAEEMDYRQYQKFTLPLYKFGYRIYAVYNTGKMAGSYKNTSFNANFDALYNFFPEKENWDLGGFVGFSLGYTSYDMGSYKVKGSDAAINGGLRLTFFKNHNIEIFARVGLNKNKYSNDTGASDIRRAANNNLTPVEVPASNDCITNQQRCELYRAKYHCATANKGDKCNEMIGSGEVTPKPQTLEEFCRVEIENIICKTGTIEQEEFLAKYEEESKKYQAIVKDYEENWAIAPGDKSTSTITTRLPKVVDTFQEFYQPLQVGIRYTYTF